MNTIKEVLSDIEAPVKKPEDEFLTPCEQDTITNEKITEMILASGQDGPLEMLAFDADRDQRIPFVIWAMETYRTRHKNNLKPAPHTRESYNPLFPATASMIKHAYTSVGLSIVLNHLPILKQSKQSEYEAAMEAEEQKEKLLKTTGKN